MHTVSISLLNTTNIHIHNTKELPYLLHQLFMLLNAL